MNTPAAERSWVALSGEMPDREFFDDHCAGVGLVRAEYLIRQAGQDVSNPETSALIGRYLRRLLGRTPGRVWYRMADLELRDVVVLSPQAKLEQPEDNPILGQRGMRRLHSDYGALALTAEAAVVAEVSTDHPGQIGVIAPFIRDDDEIGVFTNLLRASGFEGPLGAMVETPSAVRSIENILDSGVDHVLIGLNDLAGLTLGAARGSKFFDYGHPAVLDSVRTVLAAAARSRVTVRIAGNFSRALLAKLPELSASDFVVHYQDWSEVTGTPARVVDTDRDVARNLRLASDRILVRAGLMHESNMVTSSGMSNE